MSIQIEDINSFKTKSSRSENGKKNEERENMILKCFNDKFIPSWISKDQNAKKFMNSLWNCFIVIFGASYDSILEKKGGRQYNYDYLLKNNDNNKKIEFKYNSMPQFANVPNPSTYFDINFEENYFNFYLKKFSEEKNIDIPEKNIYLKNVGKSSSPELSELQERYYQGCKKSSKFTNKEEDIKIYNELNILSRKCIKHFISNSNLNLPKLSSYLNESQKGKNYLVYNPKKNEFFCITDNIDYTIEKIVKKTYNSIIVELKDKKKIKILLRWKNGNGVCFPALQISHLF